MVGVGSCFGGAGGHTRREGRMQLGFRATRAIVWRRSGYPHLNLLRRCQRSGAERGRRGGSQSVSSGEMIQCRDSGLLARAAPSIPVKFSRAPSAWPRIWSRSSASLPGALILLRSAAASSPALGACAKMLLRRGKLEPLLLMDGDIRRSSCSKSSAAAGTSLGGPSSWRCAAMKNFFRLWVKVCIRL